MSEKKEELTGFDKVADNFKKKFQKVGKNKGYSSLSLICGSGKEHEKGRFSGGLVGDPSAIIEGLFYMAKRDPIVKELMSLTLTALENEEKEINKAKDEEE